MANGLVSFVEQRAGDALRAVAAYDGEAVSLLYCRDDLQHDEMAARVDSIHDNITWEWNPREDGIIATLGEKRATL